MTSGDPHWAHVHSMQDVTLVDNLHSVRWYVYTDIHKLKEYDEPMTYTPYTTVMPL